MVTHRRSGQFGMAHWRGNSDHEISRSQRQFGRTIEPGLVVEKTEHQLTTLTLQIHYNDCSRHHSRL